MKNYKFKKCKANFLKMKYGHISKIKWQNKTRFAILLCPGDIRYCRSCSAGDSCL